MSDYTDIQPELDDLENAVYGEEVRDSMVSAIKKIHDIAESAADAPDATTATAGQAPIADGQGGWAWGLAPVPRLPVNGFYNDETEEIVLESQSGTELFGIDVSGLGGSDVTVDPTLTQSGQAADAKVVGDRVDELKSALNEIGVEPIPSDNLLNPAEIKSGIGLDTNGNEYSSGSSSTSGFIPVIEGTDYSVFTKINNVIQNPYIGRIFCYDANKSNAYSLGSISSGAIVTPKTIPNGYAYCRFMIATSYLENPVMFAETDGTMPSDIPEYGTVYELQGFTSAEETQALTNRVSALEEIMTADVDLTIYPSDGESGYCDASGNIQESADYKHITVNLNDVKSLTYTGQIRWVAAYVAVFKLSNGEFTTFGQGTNPATNYTAESLVIPENAVEVTLTWYQPTTGAKVVAVKVEQPDLTELVRTVSNLELPWSGKKWVVVGDSLTGVNEATTKHYFDYIAEASGITVANMGVGGTGYIRRYNDSQAFYQRIGNVPTDADIVTIMGSCNDWNIEAMPIFNDKTWAQALGTPADTGTDTICGAINKTIENYYTVMPVVPIGIIAPPPTQYYPTTTSNRATDYVEALKQIAEKNGIPFLDLFYCSNLRPWDATNRDACFYNGSSLDGNGDGVHPNELGHKIIAPKIYEFVKSLLMD